MSDNPLEEWLQDARGVHDHDDPVAADAEADTAADREPGDGRADWAWRPDEAATAPLWDPASAHTGRTGPSRRLLGLVVLSWTVAAALGAMAITSDALPWPRPAGRDATPNGARPETGAAPAVPDVHDAHARAAAAIAVRQAVTTAADAGGEARRYVDLAVPESVRRHGDVRIVTVAAVVLEGSAEAWHTVRPARFAVPITIDDGHVVALGAPWPLPAPRLAGDEQPWRRAAAESHGLERALREAGYRDLGTLEVHDRADVPRVLRVRVDARAPDESTSRSHEVWLRADPSPTVLGAETGGES